MIPETRGRKPKKVYNIVPGELKKFKLEERQNIYNYAKKEGFKIKTRLVNNKLIVFREI